MSKETILKELKKKDILSQTIMLNWIRSETNITFTKEIRFYKLLKDIVIKEVEEAIDQTREETIKEIIGMCVNFDDYNNDQIISKEMLEELLNKLKK